MINEICMMKKLIKLVFFLMVVYLLMGVIFLVCLEESDCFMIGCLMVYVKMYIINLEIKVVLNDIFDLLSVIVFGIDLIIINN